MPPSWTDTRLGKGPPHNIMGMLPGRLHLARPFLPHSSASGRSCSAWRPGRRARQRPLLGAALEAAAAPPRLLAVGAKPEHQQLQSGSSQGIRGCRVSMPVLEEPQVLRLLTQGGSCLADASSPTSAAGCHQLTMIVPKQYSSTAVQQGGLSLAHASPAHLGRLEPARAL